MVDSAAVTPRFLICGDAGLTVEFGARIDAALNAQVVALDADLRADPPDGVIETIPSYRALTVLFDPLRCDHSELIAAITARLQRPAAQTSESGPHWRVPVLYGGADGFDLDAVAAATGLTRAQVITHHQAATYSVYMLGFMPGFPYLGGLDPALHLPRLSNPRQQIAQGSVIIAGAQAAIAPVPMPCGWHVLGRTPLILFDPDAQPPVLLTPGAQLRFVGVDAADYAALAATPQAALAFATACS